MAVSSGDNAQRERLYSGTACSDIDAAMQAQGISALTLMSRAGAAAFDHLLASWPAVRRLCVCAGTGNNAGDGYVVAALAAQAGLAVTVLQVDGRALAGAAGHWQAEARAAGVNVVELLPSDGATRQTLAAADVVVDALLGIGLESAPRPAVHALIEQLNACARPVLALDVPSGLQADRTGGVGAIVRAARTISFLVPKVVLYSGVGVAFAGQVVEADLGLSARQRSAGFGFRWLRSVAGLWPAPAPTAYKHARGHVLVIGGEHGMFGAPLLSAEAALRSGAGLVSVITRAAAIPGLLARRPELMVRAFEDWPAAQGLLARADCIVLGPGMGRGAFARTALAAAVAALKTADNRATLVLDAEALALLAEQPETLAGLRDEGGYRTVLTPHSGEAARLLDQPGEAVEFDRLASARTLSERYGAISLLKGPGTVVVAHPLPVKDRAPGALPGSVRDEEGVYFIGTGNPGMATAGMGDVLAGVIGARLALSARAEAGGGDHADRINRTSRVGAVAAAAAVHGAAADHAAARFGPVSLVAGDVIDHLPRALRDASEAAHG